MKFLDKIRNVYVDIKERLDESERLRNEKLVVEAMEAREKLKELRKVDSAKRDIQKLRDYKNKRRSSLFGNDKIGYDTDSLFDTDSSKF